MSAEVVNLRLARKGKQRADKAVEAAANRVRFGRTRAVRQAETVETARAQRHLDGHRLGDDSESKNPAPKSPAEGDGPV